MLMTVRKGFFLLKSSLCVLALSSCSSLKKPAAKPTTYRDNTYERKVQFLDDISLKRGASKSEHRYNGRSANISRDVNRSSAILENASSWQFKYAQLLDVPVEDVNNFRLYGFIEEWYGTPYRLGGRDRAGIDCSNFVNTLMAAVFQISSIGNSVQLFEKVTKLRSRDELHEGDLVFFRINRHRISHVGIYLGNDRFVHASTSNGVMISDLNEAYWKRYYAGAGRLDNDSYIGYKP
ncbi:hypothetical protein CK934_16510 [Chitinophaga sp. MD30]|nr:hypothetical protein CK934_16510 [Chitinophaga sp. MD30]